MKKPKWNSKYELSLETARLYPPSPEGSDPFLGIRESRPFSYWVRDDINRNFVACFGGSTTYGTGVFENETWPRYLEGFGILSMNCGGGSNDIFDSLTNLLRLHLRGITPKLAIFYDGVNQRGGYTHWNSSFKHFVPYNSQYLVKNSILYDSKILGSRILTFISLVLGKSKRDFIRKYLQIRNSTVSSSFGNKLLNVFTNKTHVKSVGLYAQQESDYYISVKNMINNFCNLYGIKTLFLLQPFLGSVDRDLCPIDRLNYLDEVYSIINQSDPSVVDLSKLCIDLKSEMFYDWQHVDEKGNQIIAKTIYPYISW
jgi:hypothetical protein